jgi:hypothetical protein
MFLYHDASIYPLQEIMKSLELIETNLRYASLSTGFPLF